MRVWALVGRGRLDPSTVADLEMQRREFEAGLLECQLTRPHLGPERFALHHEGAISTVQQVRKPLSFRIGPEPRGPFSLKGRPMIAGSWSGWYNQGSGC